MISQRLSKFYFCLVVLLILSTSSCFAVQSIVTTPTPTTTPTQEPRPTRTPKPTYTPRPTPSRIAIVVYKDGRQMTLGDWLFKYGYGERDNKPTSSIFTYIRQWKTSEDLHLQTLDGRQIEIKGKDIDRITYDIVHDACYGIVVKTKTRVTYIMGYTSNRCNLDQIKKGKIYVEISDKFLSDKAYVFEQSLSLIDSNERSEIGLVRISGDQKQIELIKEIVFP